MKRSAIATPTSLIVLVTLVCTLEPLIGGAAEVVEEPGQPEQAPAQGPAPTSRPTPDLSNLPANLIHPDDLIYEGAFRLPDPEPGATDAQTWEYGGQALTYRPDGDPGGEADGYPGSLFATGHDQHNYVAEISIPAPSLSRDFEQMNTATTLQPLQDVRAGLFDGLVELPRIGLQYLPAGVGRPTATLHMAWGQHMQQEGDPSWTASHAWSDPDLAQPNTTGAWWIGDASLFSVNGYLFEIPQEWADAYVGGARLATGRYRDGGWSGMGPNLYAYAPWMEGDPPAPGARLNAVTLLHYDTWEDPERAILDSYHDADEWEGGAWITAGEKTAVVFVGTKGGGDYWWYGGYSPRGDGMPCVFQDPVDGGYCFNADGSDCPASLSGVCEGYDPASRGWWSSRFDGMMLFYDPSDFAAVVEGTLAPNEPQPYATLDIDEYLFLSPPPDPINTGTGDQRRYRIGEMAYDTERGLLYVLEWFAEGARPVVHVWRIQQ